MHTSTNSDGRSRNATRRTSTGHAIERGIPIPELMSIWQRGEGAGRKVVLDLSGMEVGDSIFVAAKTKAAVLRCRGNALQASKRSSIKTTVRAVEGGVRIWRTA